MYVFVNNLNVVAKKSLRKTMFLVVPSLLKNSHLATNLAADFDENWLLNELVTDITTK
jgi:hypothetical protein